MSYNNLPEAVNEDAAQILSDIVSDYEARANKRLMPAQNEALLIQTFAYREKLLRSNFNDGFRTQMLRYSRAPVIDLLGDIVGITRLTPQSASVTIRFTMVNPRITTVIIPFNTRVQSSDGKAVFYTKQSTSVATGTNTVDIDCACNEAGTAGNGFTAGSLTTILDPQAFIASATNTTTSGGGSDQETDDQMRVRWKAALSQFSNAGSKGAYKFFTLSAHPDIVDADILTITPGTVSIFVLTKSGVASTPILNAVTALLSDDKIKALNDTLVISSAASFPYDCNCELVLYNTADDATALAQVTAALQAFADSRRLILGKDITIDMLKRVAMEVDGVYTATFTDPVTDVVISSNEFPEMQTFSVTITGHTNG